MTDYRKEIEAWDWKQVAPDPKTIDWDDYHVHEDEEGNIVWSFYLGSLINPSGKYYLPFAHGNVNLCPVCEGEGTVPRHDRTQRITHLRDLAYRKLYHKEQKLLKEAFAFGTYWQWPEGLRYRIDHVRVLLKRRNPYVTCSYCHGIGSREAYEDELFWDALEEIANEHNGYIVPGEGDPTDTFFEMVLGNKDDIVDEELIEEEA